MDNSITSCAGLFSQNGNQRQHRIDTLAKAFRFSMLLYFCGNDKLDSHIAVFELKVLRTSSRLSPTRSR